MFTPSDEIILLLRAFAPYLSGPALRKMTTLFCGVVLSHGRRTVASALRAVGLADGKTFGKYHRLLSRDRWSALHASKALLLLLLDAFVEPDRPVELVVDETLERRSGRKIAYRGWFRDPVRSTQSTNVVSSSIRWLCVCLLVRVPWSSRRWALPFFTVPALSEKTCQKRKRPHCSSAGWTIDCLLKVREWIGQNRLIHLIGDGGFTKIELIDYAKSLGVVQIGRLRLDAGLYDAPDPQRLGEGSTLSGEAKKVPGRKPLKGKRQPNLSKRLTDPSTSWRSSEVAWYGGQQKTVEYTSGVSLWYVAGNAPIPLRWVLVRPCGQGDTKKKVSGAAFFSTDVTATAESIIASYADRWNIEVFFEEVRACLGFETQRGWSNRTIGRSTPCLFGAFSLIVVLARRLHPVDLPIRQCAWYTKEEATFRDAMSAVRSHLWKANQSPTDSMNRLTSPNFGDMTRIPTFVLAALQEIACYSV